ncbi:MAG: hypothetical protein ABI821_00695 [Pseudomonadota bacterium]
MLQLFRTRVRVILATAAILATSPARAAEDISFVAEHLPEAAMDNRYALLPLWTQGPFADRDSTRFGAGLGFTDIASDGLSLRGPMLTLSISRRIDRWRVIVFGFRDDLTFAGARVRRPLDEPFVAAPLTLPADAEFTNLRGSADDTGAGLAVGHSSYLPWLGDFEWSGGLLWQRMALAGYRAEYRILEGPQSGATGVIDFSADYSHFVPFLGISKEIAHGNWGLTPHVQLALPLPRRAVSGRISGADFDLSGDTAASGHGKHFGDPSVTLGFDVAYLPWNVSIDVGSLLSQTVLEPLIHEGISRSWVIELRWAR